MLGKATADVLKLACEARRSPVGPFSPRFDLVRLMRGWLMRELPEDAHLRCNGRLSVSLTRARDGKNVMVSNFDSKEELVQVLVCSSFIPLYSGLLPPFYKDARYWDGGITNNLPVFDSDTETVSPFSGECDICPPDLSAYINLMEVNYCNQSFRINSTNAYRLSRALFPPHPDILKKFCEEGYTDALRWIKKTLLFHAGPESPMMTECPPTPTVEAMEVEKTDEIAELPRLKLASRTNSLARKSIYQLLERYDQNTINLPSNVIDALKQASASSPHPLVQALSMAAIPWILPMEFMYSTCLRLIKLSPRPTTMKMQYYMEVSSSIAQRVAGRMVSRHGGQAWSQCSCKMEVLPTASGGSRCILHGKAIINQTHTLQFAFAIEETPAATADQPPMILSSPSQSRRSLAQRSGRLTGLPSAKLPPLASPKVETSLLTAAVVTENGVEDTASYNESCLIIHQFETEVAQYFQEQIENRPGGPHQVSMEELPV